jgi:hypothetical protein
MCLDRFKFAREKTNEKSWAIAHYCCFTAKTGISYSIPNVVVGILPTIVRNSAIDSFVSVSVEPIDERTPHAA